MEKKTENKSQQINIELGEKEAEGIYSNLAIITHSPAEFIIDFTRVVPGVPKAKVHSRIITTPQHAKMLLNALQDNIEKFFRIPAQRWKKSIRGNMLRTPDPCFSILKITVHSRATQLFNR